MKAIEVFNGNILRLISENGKTVRIGAPKDDLIVIAVTTKKGIEKDLTGTPASASELFNILINALK